LRDEDRPFARLGQRQNALRIGHEAVETHRRGYRPQPGHEQRIIRDHWRISSRDDQAAGVVQLAVGRQAGGFAVSALRRLLRFSLFWHALDIIWVGVFTLVYLMGAR